MTDKPTRKARLFMKANDESPVVSGGAHEGGGSTYTLDNGKSISLTLTDSRSLPDGYPRWPWGPVDK